MEWYVLLGISNGMRTMTPMAVVCWFSWLGLTPQSGWSFWAGNIVSAVVFTVLAVGEYYGDTRPNIGSRTSPQQLVGRLLFAVVMGAVMAHGVQEPLAGGILFSCAGVLIGAFGGVRLRAWGAGKAGNDLPVALGESALALGLAVLGAWRLYDQELVHTTLVDRMLVHGMVVHKLLAVFAS